MSESKSTDDLPMCPICFAILDDDGTCPEPENHDGKETELLAAARNWREQLIPKTGAAPWNAVVRLRQAVEAFDDDN